MSQRYLVQGKIGQGGLGEVYLAKDTQLDRDVALKRVKVPEGGNAESMAADLIREAKTLSVLQHPNIVTVYDVGQDEQGPFVVLELLKGETLDEVIARGGMTQEDFQQVVLQTLEGLIAAQAVGLVHRDLKPSNLMVVWLASGKFQLKILDFGLAKFGLKARPQTEDQGGGIFGSIYFMAPEQFERFPLDARTDMYSLGCIYYQILTTQHPFDGETGAEVMASHLQHFVKPLKQVRGDLPDWLCYWVMWLISREMDERPEDARTALEYFTAQKHGLKGVPQPPAVGTAVRPNSKPKPVYRPPGPAGSTTGPISGSASQIIMAEGTMAAARSSTPNLEKVVKPEPPKGKLGLWIGLTALLLAIGGGVAWLFLGHPETPPSEVQTPAPEPAPASVAVTPVPTPKPKPPPAPEVPKPAPTEVAVVPMPEPAPVPAPAPVIPAPPPVSKGGREVLEKLLGADLPTAIALLPTEERARTAAIAQALEMTKPGERTRLHRLVGAEQILSSSSLLRADLVSPDTAIRNAAIAAVWAWVPKPSVATDLLKCAQAGETDAAMTTYAYLVNRFGTTVENRQALIKAAIPYATTPLSKNALIVATAAIAHPSAKVLAQELQAPGAEAVITAAMARIKVYAEKADLVLGAADAYIMGPPLGAPTLDPNTKVIRGWTNPESCIGWDVEFKEKREIKIQLSLANTAAEPATYRVFLGPTAPTLKPNTVPKTASETQFSTTDPLTLNVNSPGIYRLVIVPATLPDGQSLMTLRGLLILKK